MSFKKSFIKNLFTVGSYDVLAKIAEFASTIILSRLLLPAEFGIVAMIWVFGGFIQIFQNVGFTQTIIRTDYRTLYYKHVFSLSIWFSVLMFVILSALAYPISIFFEEPKLVLPTIVLGISYITNSFNFVTSAVLIKEMKFKITGLAKFLTTLSNIILSIIFAYLGFSYWAIIIGLVLSPLAQYAVYEYHLRFGFKLYGWKKTMFIFKKIKELILVNSINGTIDYWAKNTDNMMVGKLYGSADLGIFNRARRFLNMFNYLIASIFISVTFPSLKKLKSEGADYKKEFLEILGMLNLVSIPVAVVLIAIPKFIVNVLWGQNWIDVAIYMPYFGILLIIQSMIILTFDLYILENKEKDILKLGIPSSIIMVIAIVGGSFVSMLFMVRLYCLTYIAIVIPFNVIYGFHNVLKYSYKDLAKFWLPKIIISLLILGAVWIENQLFVIATFSAYILHLILNQRSSIQKLLVIGINIIKKRGK